MGSWLTQYLTDNPDLAALPIAKRFRAGIAFDKGGGLTEYHFTGKPVHAESSPGSGIFDVIINTDLVNRGTYYSPTGVPLRWQNGEVVIEGGTYKQRPARVVRLRPSTGGISNIATIPTNGTVSGSTATRTGTGWTYVVRFLEDGAREELTLSQAPTFPGGTQQTDYIMTEEALAGISFPDGWLDTEYVADGYRFHLPSGHDANGNEAPIRRYAKTSGGVQYLYTGVPVSWLSSAVYPVVIDPDFEGDTADGLVNGKNATYATARSTSIAGGSTGTTERVGQLYDAADYIVYRKFLKFDTSSLDDAATITQVNLKMVATTDASNTDFDVQIVKQDWSAQDPLDSGNWEAAYDNCLSGTADSNIWRNTSGLVVNTQYTSGNLDTTWVNKTGSTYYGLRSSRDYNNNEPGGNEFIILATANHGTAGYRPVLSVVTGGGGPPGAAPPNKGLALIGVG